MAAAGMAAADAVDMDITAEDEAVATIKAVTAIGTTMVTVIAGITIIIMAIHGEVIQETTFIMARGIIMDMAAIITADMEIVGDRIFIPTRPYALLSITGAA